MSAGLHALMGAAMSAMVWPWGVSVPVWLQAAVFGPATIWFLARAADQRLRVSPRPIGLTALRRLHHALMAAAMLWMTTALSMPGTMPIPESMSRSMSMSGSMAMAMPESPRSPTVVAVVSVLLGGYFVLVGLAWVPGAVAAHAPRRRVLDAAGHAAMSLGMGTLLLARL
ncbi:DUF5134 domain-containing protein [Streptomyces sp. H10-C2]|uniref:DUF5134 domain-containing protein n=1 Tax=unclassified Streptomyces TaxID=2593676 RepID=UPI0024B9BDE2|nr:MULTISPECIES: DUF5134 domain-containing protein [unclassified Streptomyces]MDJ0345744.1 DUF5134 domain-containing protein [Streptomyces sp. PH10-H1]MDJ0374634.1 DUF5134 domain-containing protein [Streptomyces sp. H10-C2]